MYNKVDSSANLLLRVADAKGLAPGPEAVNPTNKKPSQCQRGLSESHSINLVMTHSGSCHRSFVSLARTYKRLQISEPLTQCLVPRLFRNYASHAELPTAVIEESSIRTTTSKSPTRADPVGATQHDPETANRVFTTLYSWPSMSPSSFSSYKADQLNLPLRRDILHRAVIYEGDNTRQGSGSTKHRTQVQGSSRKIRPQKGTGSARLSDRKSPSIRGGGVAHGPHPRDFGTELPSKIYNLAWRTALSYRYKKGELIILENKVSLRADQTGRWLHNFFLDHGWGKGNGRTLLVRYPAAEGEEDDAHLLASIEQVGEHVKVKDTINVDVKDLLSCGRVMIERQALRQILRDRA